MTTRVAVLAPEEVEALIAGAVRRAVAELRALEAPSEPAGASGPLTVEQACTVAQCSPKTLWRACRSGAIEGATKPPGLDGWRIPREALQAWLGRGKVRPARPPEVHAEADRIAARIGRRG
jgi:excisionase family DNA binding protein